MNQATPYQHLAALYDRLMGRSMTPIILNAFEEAVKKHHIQYRTIADVGCGTGTFLRCIAAPGLSLIGVDRSIDMLRLARKKLRNTGVKLYRQDMRQLKLLAPVDLITCNFDTLNYLIGKNDFIFAIDRFCDNLKPEGYLIFDILTGDGFPPKFETARQRIKLRRCKVDLAVKLDGRSKRSVVRITFNPLDGGSRTAETHCQQWYPTAWVSDQLCAAGFQTGQYNLSGVNQPNDGATGFWVQFVARKMT